MNDRDTLIKEIDSDGLAVVDPATLAEAFSVPSRNWNLIVDTYNASTKRKFPFTSLQCKLLVEYVKKGIPPKYIFKTIGVSNRRYGLMMGRYTEMEDRFEQLSTKESLNEEEFAEFTAILRHPLRLLMADLERAEGASDLADWEKFNEHAANLADVHLVKMRAKFKDIFGDKQSEGNGYSVSINLGGTWIDEL